MLNIKQNDDGTAGLVNEDGKFVVNFNYVETGSTSSNLKNYGLSTISATGAKTFTLDAPVKGAYKEIVKTANSTAIATVAVGSTSSGITVSGSTDVVTKILFNGQNDSVSLRGISDSKWLVISNNSVTLST
jgi:hypothetical protein